MTKLDILLTFSFITIRGEMRTGFRRVETIKIALSPKVIGFRDIPNVSMR